MSALAAPALHSLQPPLVAARELTFGYPHRQLYRDVSFDIESGAVLGIVGPNGCGKSTLLRTILGLQPALHGNVTHAPGLAISYVPQRERLDVILPLTALDVVLMGRTARAGALARIRPEDDIRARRALAQLGIEPLAAQSYRSLSGGQQQRVLLARALAGEADMLVLDEPTAGMDLGSEAGIVAFLRDLNHRQGTTILLVTHLLPLVLDLATSILLFGRDRILHGTLDEVMREERLSALYGVPVRVGRFAGRRMVVAGH